MSPQARDFLFSLRAKQFKQVASAIFSPLDEPRPHGPTRFRFAGQKFPDPKKTSSPGNFFVFRVCLAVFYFSLSSIAA
jgi:hypothetical protein